MLESHRDLGVHVALRRRIVEMVHEDLRKSKIFKREACGKYLMKDFYDAGGLPFAIREIGASLHKNVLTVNGRSRKHNCDADVVRHQHQVDVDILARTARQLSGS